MDKYYEWIKETLKSENVDLDQLQSTSDVEVLEHIQNAVRDLRDSLEIVRQHIGITEENLHSRAKVHTCAIHGDKLVVSESEEAGPDEHSAQLEGKLGELPLQIKERHVSSKTKCLYFGLPYYFEPDRHQSSESPDSSDLEAINHQCGQLKDHYLHLLQRRKGPKSNRKSRPKAASSTQTSAYPSETTSTLESRSKERKKTPPVPTECNEPKVSVIEGDLDSDSAEKAKPQTKSKATTETQTSEKDFEVQKLDDQVPEKLENSSQTSQKADSEVQTEKIDYPQVIEQITDGRRLHKINNCIFLDPEPRIVASAEQTLRQSDISYLQAETYSQEESFIPPGIVPEQVKLIEEKVAKEHSSPKTPKKAKPKRRSSSKGRKTVKEFGSQTDLSPKKKPKAKTVQFEDTRVESSSQTVEERFSCPFLGRHASDSHLHTFPLGGHYRNCKSSSSQTDLTPTKEACHSKDMEHSSNMAARIDLHIQVSSNVKVDGNADNESEGSKKDDKRDANERSSDEQASVDNPKLTIRVVSEENLNVTNLPSDFKISKTSTENLNIEQSDKFYQTDSRLDVDNTSLHSLSEGDNSVFSDNPTEEGAIGGERRSARPSETQEEVDDIELIFSSDENKDYGQEDLVPIGEYEPWQEMGATGTPVLVKFKKIPSLERDKENKKEVRRQDSGAQTDKSAENVESDSFSLETRTRGHTKSSSLEKESSTDQDVITREESFDTFEAVIPATAIQRRWTKASILVETDISKCGITEEITEEALLGLPRRNTCPNPAPYRPIIHTTTRQVTTRSPLAVKFNRSPRTYASHFQAPKTSLRCKISETEIDDFQRCSSAVQTDISALPPQWRSESHLVNSHYDIGLYTLPSKYEGPRRLSGVHKCPLRLSEKTQEARRVLLSDINFTSMVPELSRSADHICPENELGEAESAKVQEYYKGNLLQTPDYSKGLTQSYSLTSPGISNWTVNEGSQTTQTGGYWDRGDSFDSTKSYSFNSKQSNLEKHHRSRSVPSVRCVVCRQAQTPTNMRVSESMHYTPRTTHHESETPSKIRGSLPDLRHHCNCTRRYEGHSLLQVHAESIGSAESLIEEPEELLVGSTHNVHHSTIFEELRPPTCHTMRRCSENDLERHFTPPNCSSPFLPKTPECLKLGHLVKVILKNGRVAVGRVRYVGRVSEASDEPMIGIQLPTYWGDSDGSVGDRRYFQCPPQHGTFVSFSKIVMAWNV